MICDNLKYSYQYKDPQKLYSQFGKCRLYGGFNHHNYFFLCSLLRHSLALPVLAHATMLVHQNYTSAWSLFSILPLPISNSTTTTALHSHDQDRPYYNMGLLQPQQMHHTTFSLSKTEAKRYITPPRTQDHSSSTTEMYPFPCVSPTPG